MPDPVENRVGSSSVEEDYRRTVADAGDSYFLPGTSIEIIRAVRAGIGIRHVLFDFDGTLSLIREGWPEVMVPMMVDELRATGTTESIEDLSRHCHDFVMRLNGKQTIYQMIRLAEEIRIRGGNPQEPVLYKQKYHRLLMERIHDRLESLRTGRSNPEHYLVPGSIGLLTTLHGMGLQLYLASGTDRPYVLDEAALLGLTQFFGNRIYGAIDDFRGFSKKMVIDRILRENRLEGDSLLGFGDGYVEIENIKAAGGTAIAVASDESHRSGKPDAWKRDRLIGVAADIVIPDFREGDALIAYLFRKESC
jgi:phosphoglycolate phosphatase-like HAD superfamily hydrolase